MSRDRIERAVLLHAPKDRVWRAISDSNEFGSWFGVKFDGPFEAGSKLHGRITPTTVDPEVAKTQEPYSGALFEIVVETIEPQRLFSFRWHPFAVDPNRDYSAESTTLVEFTLADTPGGILLTITESGFDQLPENRRGEAFTMNEGGWNAQIQLVEKYVMK